MWNVYINFNIYCFSKNYYGGHWASFNLEDFQNVGTKNIFESSDLSKKLGKSEESFQQFGNELSNLLNFQANWHIEEYVKIITYHLNTIIKVG